MSNLVSQSHRTIRNIAKRIANGQASSCSNLPIHSLSSSSSSLSSSSSSSLSSFSLLRTSSRVAHFSTPSNSAAAVNERASLNLKDHIDIVSADVANSHLFAGQEEAANNRQTVKDPILETDRKKDLNEVNDPELIFRSVWSTLLSEVGSEELMCFPREIMWLAGAPGAGKGAMTPFIMEYRGITSPPIEVGALLTSPEAKKIKAEGKLVNDKLVIELLFRELLKPTYQVGALVDGFPRTKEQAECIKLLYDRQMELSRKYADTPLYSRFPRPIFHITVLFIDKDESVKRQLRRGVLAKQHNDMVLSTGIGEIKPVRETDIDPKLAEERYRLFKDQVYASLQTVKQKFHFHFIDAAGSPEQVTDRIVKELKYQSTMELNDATFQSLRKIPLAAEVIVNARHELVKRLDNYVYRHSDLFYRVVELIQTDMIHIIKRQSISGRAIIRSENPIFLEPGAIDMALDILTERGFTVTLDLRKTMQPIRVELKTGEIISREVRTFEFQIEFTKPTIRRG